MSGCRGLTHNPTTAITTNPQQSPSKSHKRYCMDASGAKMAGLIKQNKQNEPESIFFFCRRDVCLPDVVFCAASVSAYVS